MQALLLFVAVAGDAATFFGAVPTRMAAMVAAETNGGLMEPLTKIDAGSVKWLGILAIACTVLAELLTLADSPDGQRATFAQREAMRRSIRHTSRAR